MSVLVSTDFTVWKCENKFYSKFAFVSILERYSQFLGKIILCTRVVQSETIPEDFIDMTDSVDQVIPCGRLDGILRRNSRAIKEVVDKCDVVLGRFPGFIPMMTASVARKKNVPCFAEVMGCGWDAYWNHGFSGKIVAPYIFFRMRLCLKKSQYALYVTEHFLQKRYPCKRPSVGVSNVVIDDITQEVIDRRKHKLETMDSKQITLMTCAAVDVWYKGQHFVIRSIPRLNQMGIHVKYYCVGQGDRSYLKEIARKCGVEDQVIFTGAVPHETVFELLDECDIYVQPSLQEGLPRAVVEAMSRGCPVVGYRTGGIPELIHEECVIKRKAVSGIADTIKMMLEKGLVAYSEQNFGRAMDFRKEVLNGRRNAYFEYVKQDIYMQAE